MIISSSLFNNYGSLRKGCIFGGSDEATGADIGDTFDIFETTCFGSVFKVRVRAMDVPEIVVAGRFRF